MLSESIGCYILSLMTRNIIAVNLDGHHHDGQRHHDLNGQNKNLVPSARPLAKPSLQPLQSMLASHADQVQHAPSYARQIEMRC